MGDNEIICNCMQVTRGDIVKAIKDKALQTLEKVGEETEAGTGCGSCLEEIEKILKELNA